MRSFHLTEEHGEGSKCPSLGLTSEQAKMIIDKKDFICKNCKYRQHQCSACGLLWSSDLSSGAECLKTDSSISCRKKESTRLCLWHFYHRKCISKLRHPDSKVRASLFEQHVAAGLKFFCHVHKCIVCHGEENKDDKNMQFAVCRLCPTTYHRKCLPSVIPFAAKEGPNGYIIQRAWDGILRDQILRPRREIIKELGIPRRKLIIFPEAKTIFAPKDAESTPKEQDILVEQELLGHPSSEPSQTLPQPATIQNQWFRSNPMDSFAPSSLYTDPYPGSCGWLDD
ncbi:hypothetical protein GQ55_3G058200 [Panicum hallii var. hallii]|uniref:Uncharacterized protein n=1 Tax=Panicum hallii var. hallii TaxID=1504633 RepID=A0A2T7E652_9POAL|nr:hypothetical protein GQ55_3G058200 [Panicum hallii var. hallii]